MSKIVKSSVDLFHGFNLSDELKSTYEEWFSQFQCKLTLRLRRQLIFLTATNLYSYYNDDGTPKFFPNPIFRYMSMFEGEKHPVTHISRNSDKHFLRYAYTHWIYVNGQEIGISNISITKQTQIPFIPDLIVNEYESMFYQAKPGASYFYYSNARKFTTHNKEYENFPLLVFDSIDWMDRNDILHGITEFITFADQYLAKGRSFRMYNLHHRPDTPVFEDRFTVFLSALVSEEQKFSTLHVTFWCAAREYIRSYPKLPLDKYEYSWQLELLHDSFLDSPFIYTH